MQGLLSQNYLSKASIFGASGGIIKSIQVGEVLIDSASTNTSVSISPVDRTKSIILASFRHTNAGSPANRVMVTSEILNDTTLRFMRESSGIVVNGIWQVIEFKNVKSKQQGKFSIVAGATTFDVTISPVDINRSFCIVTKQSPGTTSDIIQASLTYKLTAPDKLTMNFYSGGPFHWQVIEF
jgi:hypothetical protein